jgi:tetratricopeptide (TPR) repeat protein
MCSDPVEAVRLLDQSLSIEPDFVEARLWRGLALSQLELWDEAIDDLTFAVRQSSSPQAYAWRGLAFMRSGNFLGSRKDLDYSIELDSSQHRAWNFRGGLNLAEEKMDAACRDFSRGCRNGDCTGLDSARAANICK